jgi:hypothetical protein
MCRSTVRFITYDTPHSNKLEIRHSSQSPLLCSHPSKTPTIMRIYTLDYEAVARTQRGNHIICYIIFLLLAVGI